MPLVQASTLFQDVRVLDTRTGTVGEPTQVMVRDGLVEMLVPSAEHVVPADGATVIDGGGRVLIPGLIDAHWHAAFAAVPLGVASSADPGYLQIVAGWLRRTR